MQHSKIFRLAMWALFIAVLSAPSCKIQKITTNENEFFTPPPDPEKWLWEEGLRQIMGLNAEHTINQQASNLKMKGAFLKGDYLFMTFDNGTPQRVDTWQFYPYVINWQPAFVAADGFAFCFMKNEDFTQEMTLNVFDKRMKIFTPASSTTAKGKKEATLTFKKAD